MYEFYITPTEYEMAEKNGISNLLNFKGFSFNALAFDHPKLLILTSKHCRTYNVPKKQYKVLVEAGRRITLYTVF